MVVVIVSWWSTQTTETCTKRSLSTRLIRPCSQSLRSGTCSFKLSAGWRHSTTSTLCIAISSQPISSWTRTSHASLEIWMCPSWLIKMDWITRRQVHRTTLVLRSGETSPMTSRVTCGRSDALSTKWSLWSHLFRRKTCKACSRVCLKANTQDCRSSTRRIWTRWSSVCSTSLRPRDPPVMNLWWCQSSWLGPSTCTRA